MNFNLALILLRICMMEAIGKGDGNIRLVWFKHLHGIPNDTFYRHVNSLITEGYIIREKRDTYRFHPDFVWRMRRAPKQLSLFTREHDEEVEYSDIPF